MRKTNNTKSKLIEKIRDDLSVVLRQNVNDPRVTFVSLTRVEINDDYSKALVYWDSFKTEEKKSIQGALNRMIPRLRNLLGKSIQMRHTPQLEFIYDSQFEDENRITEILQKERPE